MNAENKKKALKITIIAICCIAIIVSSILIAKHYLKDPEPKPMAPEKAREKFSNDDAKTLYYNNFLIAYLIEGNVETGEGSAKDENEIEYFVVTDELLKDLNNISDITNLIDNNLSTEMASYFISLLQDENYNNYFSINDKLYVRKSESPCDMPIVNKKDITYKIENSNVIIMYKEYANTAFYNDKIENGKWELNAVTHTCQSREQIKEGINSMLEKEK